MQDLRPRPWQPAPLMGEHHRELNTVTLLIRTSVMLCSVVRRVFVNSLSSQPSSAFPRIGHGRIQRTHYDAIRGPHHATTH
jgi:hypothetical protein